MAYTDDDVSAVQRRIKDVREKLMYALDYRTASEDSRRETYRMLNESIDMLTEAARRARP